MLASRFNCFVYKALSTTAIYAPVTIQSRYFARSPTSPKKSTKSPKNKTKATKTGTKKPSTTKSSKLSKSTDKIAKEKAKKEAKKLKELFQKAVKKEKLAAKRQKIKERKLAKKEKLTEKRKRIKERIRKSAKKEKLKEKRQRIKEKALDTKLLKQFPDPNLPKRPLNGYFRFANEYRNNNNLVLNPKTMKDTAQQTGNAWNGLSDASRAHYSSEYAKDRKKYDAFMKQYKDNKKHDAWIAKLKRALPNKPANSGYTAYVKYQCAESMKKDPFRPGVVRLTTVAKQWNGLSVAEKEKWSQNAKQAYLEWKRKLYK